MMKQEALASLLGVSQAHVSRLESGLVAPSDDVLDRIDGLLDLPENRSPFEHWAASISFSPLLAALLRIERGAFRVKALGRGFAEAPSPLNRLRAGQLLRHEFGPDAARRIREVADRQEFLGEVRALEGVWRTEDEAAGERFWRSVLCPVRDELGDWHIHAMTAEIARETHAAWLDRHGDAPVEHRHPPRPAHSPRTVDGSSG